MSSWTDLNALLAGSFNICYSYTVKIGGVDGSHTTRKQTRLNVSSFFSAGLEDDGSEPPHERPDAAESDPPGPPVPPPVPVRSCARSGLHHVRRHPGNHLSGHRQLQKNGQAPSGSQGAPPSSLFINAQVGVCERQDQFVSSFCPHSTVCFWKLVFFICLLN